MEVPFSGAIDVEMIFPLLWEWIKKKTNFLVWGMTLLHCLVVIKYMAVEGAIYSILYNLVPKEIITKLGLDLYT